MTLTAADVVRVLGACGAAVDAPPWYVLQQAGEPRFKLSDTLASAWRAEGVELAPEVHARLDAIADRQARYRAVLDELAPVEGFAYHKGWRIGQLLPQGWVRPSNDVDVQVAGVDAAMRAWRVLHGLGFAELLFCTVARRDGEADVAFGLQREQPFPHCRRGDAVEISTCLLTGHGVRAPARHMPPGADVSPLVETALAIADEQLQRDLSAKDVLDGVVVLRAMGPDERTQLGTAARALGRERQVAGLLDAVAATGLVPLDRADRPGRGARLAGTVRPVAAAARRPGTALARLVQEHVVDRSTSPLVARAERRLRRRMTYRDAWDAGLWFFGIPSELRPGAPPPPGELTVGARHATLGTPIGALPLAPWTEVPEEDLHGGS